MAIYLAGIGSLKRSLEVIFRVNIINPSIIKGVCEASINPWEFSG